MEHSEQGLADVQWGQRCQDEKYSKSPVEKQGTAINPPVDCPSDCKMRLKLFAMMDQIFASVLKPLTSLAAWCVHAAAINMCLFFDLPEDAMRLRYDMKRHDLEPEPICCVTLAPSPCSAKGMQRFDHEFKFFMGWLITHGCSHTALQNISNSSGLGRIISFQASLFFHKLLKLVSGRRIGSCTLPTWALPPVSGSLSGTMKLVHWHNGAGNFRSRSLLIFWGFAPAVPSWLKISQLQIFCEIPDDSTSCLAAWATFWTIVALMCPQTHDEISKSAKALVALLWKNSSSKALALEAVLPLLKACL